MAKLRCGIDEAGRGPLAGPVTAAAVVLPRRFPVSALADSKQLTPEEREEAAVLIRQCATAWATGWCSAAEIDTLNIHRASLLAMWRALRRLRVEPDEVLIDGRFALPLAVPCRAIVKGDRLVPEIMAASIIAKTDRDRFMRRYARIEPAYYFHEHKGYATPNHRFLLRLHGPSPIHRRSFAGSERSPGTAARPPKLARGQRVRRRTVTRGRAVPRPESAGRRTIPGRRLSSSSVSRCDRADSRPVRDARAPDAGRP